ncbi:MAG: hypothetical protein ACI9WC_001376 [Arenicella sp.]|jgi:uncharacterized caspase-like protein
MLKVIILLVFACLLAQCPAYAVSSAASTTTQINKCFSAAAIYAVPACESLIASNSLDHKIHFHLAKLYQKQNQLDKSKTTLEYALKLFDSVGDQKIVAKTARVKSNIDEAIWLQAQDKTENKSAGYRVKCIKFSSVLPKLAMPACDAYLAGNPGDALVQSHRAKALASFSKSRTAVASKTDKDTADKQSAVPAKPASISSKVAVQTSNRESPAKIVKVRQTRNNKRIENEVLLENVKGQSTPSQTSSLSKGVAPDSVPDSMKGKMVIDPKIILDIKNELKGLYALLEEQKANQAAQAARVSPTFEYKERGKRYALVMGNAAYDPAIGQLKNSVNDAVDISEKLKKLNFQVSLVTDSNLQNMEQSVEALARKLQADDTVLFYYAGHGVALEGENYLLPTKMGIKDAVDVRYKSLNLSYVLDKLDRGSSGVTMVVLDACRNNPFPVSRGAARRGLVPASGPVGTIIAYSTAPGDVAIDGAGRNGLYTKHLLNEMDKPNIKLEDVFKKVRVAVEGETQGSQVPWENSSLKGDFYFRFN